MRLGLLGGTFDPPHFGHLLLAQSAFEQFSLAGVLFIPTGHPFYKATRSITDPERRFMMLQAALADDARFEVSRIEIDREGPSYTIDTLGIIDQACQGLVELYLIVGADALVYLPTWKRAEAIARLVTVLYAARPGTAEEALDQAVADRRFRIKRIEQSQIDISSTALRARVAQSLSLRYYTPAAVADYIAEQGLYIGGLAC